MGKEVEGLLFEKNMTNSLHWSSIFLMNDEDLRTDVAG
jgi:hypothetical protein